MAVADVSSSRAAILCRARDPRRDRVADLGRSGSAGRSKLQDAPPVRSRAQRRGDGGRALRVGRGRCRVTRRWWRRASWWTSALHRSGRRRRLSLLNRVWAASRPSLQSPQPLRRRPGGLIVGAQSPNGLVMAASPLDFSIVLPAYNEAPNVAPMLAALHEVLVPLGCFEI